MKKILCVLMCVLAAGIAWGQELSLVEAISSPDSSIEGIALENSGEMWVCYSSYATVYSGKIVKIDMGGNVLTSFNAPGKLTYSNLPATDGLAYDGTYLWVINWSDDNLYKITKTGEVVGSFKIPDSSESVTWDGGNLWIANSSSNKIYKIDSTTGTILHTINSPEWESGIKPDSLAYDGQYLCVSNNDGKKIYKIDPKTGEIITKYTNSFDYGTVYALAWDGKYLLTGGSKTSAIKKYKVAQIPEGYLNPTMEQVELLPENYEGLLLYFDKAYFNPEVADNKITSFDKIIYGVSASSKDGKYYRSYLVEDTLNFYVNENFATDMIYATLPDTSCYANFYCFVEKLTTSEGIKTYWMCKIIKIEIRGDDGYITQTLEETGTPPPNPVGEAVKAERLKWDVDGDGKNGLPEAIRSLQVTTKQ